MNDRIGAYPVLKLTLESMSQSILHAFTDQQMQMDSMLQNAVKAFCTPDNLRSIIDDQVRASIKSALKQEVGNFFEYGDGRKTIKEAVLARLERDYKA